MGTSVACELCARRERGLLSFEMRSLVLTNGSVHIELAHLTPSQRILATRIGDAFARLSSRRLFTAQMRRIMGVPIPDEEYAAMWAELSHRDGRLRLPKVIGYLEERRKFWHRWIGALTRLDLRTLVLWGPKDPVAVLAIAEQLAREIPGARFERLEGLGHYPMLEDPARFGAAVARFLEARSTND
jgi:pimeloyl-ACP methyl ester carboxylesterase